MSNYPLTYKLSWLPRLLRPSLRGDRRGLLPAKGALLPLTPERTTRLLFIGDISAVANKTAPEVDSRLKALIESADLVIGNCESAVVERVRHSLGTITGARHVMTPGFLAATIEAAGIAPRRLVLSLANNHMLDQGIDGYTETRAALAQMGIATIGGTGDGLVRSVEVGDLTIGFAAFTQWRNVSQAEYHGRVTMLDDLVADRFAALRRDSADLVCVAAHWDREFRHFPQDVTRKLAATLVERGAGLIVGHHAHVLQPAERIGDALVAYGLGDFLGTALPRVPWPLWLGGMLAADISVDPQTKGRIAAYGLVPFVRERTGGREKLAPLDAVGGALGKRMRDRFDRVFPGGERTDLRSRSGTFYVGQNS